MSTREDVIRYEAEILRDANIALTENLSLEKVLETLLEYLARLIPYDSANVMLRNGESKFVVSAVRRYEGYQDVANTRAISFDANDNGLLRRWCLTHLTILNGKCAVAPITCGIGLACHSFLRDR